MLPLTFTALAAILFHSATAFELPCSGHYSIYEDHPTHSVNTGGYGYIYRYQGRTTSTSLCTVNFPAWAAGHQCKLHFGPVNYVDQGEPNRQTSKRGQVFTLGSPDISTATWNARGSAYRDQQIGTFINASPDVDAEWEGSNTFPCPSSLKGFEIVPSGDNVLIGWDSPDGLSVEIL